MPARGHNVWRLPGMLFQWHPPALSAKYSNGLVWDSHPASMTCFHDSVWDQYSTVEIVLSIGFRYSGKLSRNLFQEYRAEEELRIPAQYPRACICGRSFISPVSSACFFCTNSDNYF
ncbi:hypothetical protein DWV16_15935 [Anaerotruncus sp. AF02-27]|nr:hypothetical protein DWV16_15935 [Anaerotruncus sp. AF02-27]